MEATAITIVSHLITDARSRWGAHAITRLDVRQAVLDEAMDHVLELGGRVTIDSCTVEGVEVHALPDGEDVPRAWVRGEAEPRPLTAPES